jgi:outer membrane cobalamin receptor
VALEWAPHARTRVRAGVGRYYRAPSLTELFGSPSTIAPSPALQEEHAWKAEVGWDARFPIKHWLWRETQASFTLSGAWAENQISLVPNSQMSFVAQNIGRSRVISPEAGFETGLGEALSVRANAAILWTENLSDSPMYRGKALPLRPAYRGGFEAEWNRRGWRVTYSLQATGAMFADSAGSRALGAFWEHGLWASWESKRWGTWILEGRNLTDAMTVAGTDWNFVLNQNTTGLAGYPAPGRRIYFTWRYEL